MAFVSVVVPVFNGEEVLADQLEALACQDYGGPWELVLADNGSTDGSMGLSTRFAVDVGVKRVDASLRRGNAAARNQGAEGASGKLLLFCDQDDVVGPTWISDHVAALQTGAVSIGPFDMKMQMDEPGSLVSMPMYGVYGYLPYGLSSNLGLTRELFVSLGGFDESYPSACDVDLCWRAQLEGNNLQIAESAVVAKRKRGAGDVWRQHFSFGCDDVRLYTRFRNRGMPRSWIGAAKALAWLVANSLMLFRADRRATWLGVAAQRVGRLVGSFRMRVIYP
jgi:GT2 family glycosyltransferase